MPVSDRSAKALGRWLDTVGDFTVSHFDDPGWGIEEVVADWIWREGSRRLAFATPNADRAHVLTLEDIQTDLDGWTVETTSGVRVSLQITNEDQRTRAADWRRVRPLEWTWPLRSLLGDVPGEDPTP